MRRLGELLEAELLVPLHLAGIGAEADRRPALGLRALEEGLEQLLPDALAAAARDDGDRQLRRLLVDEAEARLVGGEHAVPRGAVRVRAFHGDDAGVALASPVADVAVDGPLRVLAHPPVVRVAEHVAEEARVLSVGGPKHGQSSCASCTRFPSGSYTSSSRISPVSSSTMPTSAPAARSRSASALMSGTSTCATAPSSCGSPSARPISMSPRRRCAQRFVKSTAVSSNSSVSRKKRRPASSSRTWYQTTGPALIAPGRDPRESSSPSSGSPRRSRRRPRDGRTSGSWPSAAGRAARRRPGRPGRASRRQRGSTPAAG